MKTFAFALVFLSYGPSLFADKKTDLINEVRTGFEVVSQERNACLRVATDDAGVTGCLRAALKKAEALSDAVIPRWMALLRPLKDGASLIAQFDEAQDQWLKGRGPLCALSARWREEKGDSEAQRYACLYSSLRYRLQEIVKSPQVKD